MFECVFRTKIKRNHLETKQNMNNFHTKIKNPNKTAQQFVQQFHQTAQQFASNCSAAAWWNCWAVWAKLLSSLVKLLSSLGQTAGHLVQTCWFVWYLLAQNYVVLVWVCCWYIYIYMLCWVLCFKIKNTALNWHQHRGNDALETLQCQK